MEKIRIVHVYEEENDSMNLKEVEKIFKSTKIVPDDGLGSNEQTYNYERGYC